MTMINTPMGQPLRVSEFRFDKEKYLQMAKTNGLPYAITELHNELRELEHETFEGNAGYQPELWEKLKDIRNFSIELWNLHRAQVGAGGTEPRPLTEG